MADATCSFDGCERPTRTRGWCSMHYKRWKTHGDPAVIGVGGQHRVPLEVRFWQKVGGGHPNPTECWLWQGGITGAGYGLIAAGAPSSEQLAAHRVAYEIIVGPIPVGLELDHLCRVRHCVNPSHLEPVTHQENLRRSDVVTGLRSAKTHCPHGHPYDNANTSVRNGRRHCRECSRQRARRSR